MTRGVKYYVIIFAVRGLRRCTPPIAPLLGLSSGLWVLSLSLLRDFAGVKKPSKVSLLGTRKRTAPRI